jgi:ABC-type phosphonate transport system ATPase subunit
MLHKYGHPTKKSTVNSYAIFSGVTSISVSMYPKKELGGESGRGKSAYVSSV